MTNEWGFNGSLDIETPGMTAQAFFSLLSAILKYQPSKNSCFFSGREMFRLPDIKHK
jgi:hypothetical protein